jgi:hypothetical protein
MKTCWIITALAIGASATLWFTGTPARAQAQPGSNPEPDRAELRLVKPDQTGFRHGKFIEPDPMNFADHTGYVSIFDGKTLNGWDGKPGIWSVEDGALVGVSSKEKNAGNTFLIYRPLAARDFDLKLEIKVERGGGSGIQYRSSTVTQPAAGADAGGPVPDSRWVMIGPQADFWYPVNDAAKQYSGQLYSQNTSKGIIAWRGQVVESQAGAIPRLEGVIGDRGKLGAYVKDGAWNQYLIIARGGVMMHILNGQLMAVLVDDDPLSSNNVSGLIGLQLESFPCKVSFRDLWIRKIN